MFPMVINTLDGILILIGIYTIGISNIVFILLYQKYKEQCHKYKNQLRIARLANRNEHQTDSPDDTE
jgi:hypothetical protein